MKDSNIELPVAVLSEKPSEYRVVVDKKALGSLGGDAQAFVEELRRQGVLQGNGNTAQASL